MNIVEPYAKLIKFGDDNIDNPSGLRDFTIKDGEYLLCKIEWCARISHRSEDKQTGDSWQRFIKFVVLEKGDWSVVEHASVTVDAMVDRGITHEWVRHRLFSFTQESTRFVNYEKKMPASFVIPNEITFIDGDWNKIYPEWTYAIQQAEMSYRGLLAKGVSPQIARSVLPNALASRIITTGNLRQWRHFLLMRTTKETHPQMRQVTIPLLVEFKEKIPLLFDDIEPEIKQSEAMKKVR